MKKYELISNEMRERINKHFYPIDQPIPDEHSLCDEFGCSRMTMKRALDILVMEGLLFRKRGHGTFIIQSSSIRNDEVNVISEQNLGLTNVIKDHSVSSKVIRFDIQFPPQAVADILAVTIDTPVYYIVRLRCVDNEPYVIEKTYMSSLLIPGITREVLDHSIYNHIQQTLDLKIGGAHRKIRASKPNELDQEYLGCKPDDPILEVEQIGFLNNGVPFEYSFSRHRYDKFVFTTVTVSKN
ncbi:GntR family transcriptional regulator [Bacillus sp. 1P06AnD]|uniref:GntR family transcriptional regulator n=1 Tax=Bacillus sp. 1P06AnD TaxID=3132208 RepID=UPI00399FB501